MKSVLLLFSLFLFTAHLSSAEFSQDIPCEAKTKQIAPKPSSVMTFSQRVIEPITLEQKNQVDAYCQQLSEKPLLESYDFGYGENLKFYRKHLLAHFHRSHLGLIFSNSPEKWKMLFDDNAIGFIREYSIRYPNAIPVLINPDFHKQIISFGKEIQQCSSDPESCGISVHIDN